MKIAIGKFSFEIWDGTLIGLAYLVVLAAALFIGR
jgi:hypothetical protein